MKLPNLESYNHVLAKLETFQEFSTLGGLVWFEHSIALIYKKGEEDQVQIVNPLFYLENETKNLT